MRQERAYVRRRRTVVGGVALVGLATGGLLHALSDGGRAVALEPSATVRAVTETRPPTAATTPTPTHAVPTVSARTSPTSAPAAVRAALTVAAKSAGADMAVAVYDETDDDAWSLDDSGRFDTASIVKMSILGATLVQQQDGRVLDGDTREDMAGMIESSDNADASELWAEAGSGPGVMAFDRSVGTTATTADPAGDWGLTLTSAADQVQVMRAIAYPSAVLTKASQAQAVALLDAVDPDQRWGAGGGVPAGVDVDVKDGWLPHGSGWIVNSVAHVRGLGRDYVVAILSQGSATEATGITALQSVSAAIWQTAAVG